MGAALPCALAPAPRFRRPTETAFGQASRPGERRIITMVNTHETVASIGLDNSHDALLPLAWRQVRRAARFPPLQAWSAFTRAARFPRSCLARRCRGTPPQLVLINPFLIVTSHEMAMDNAPRLGSHGPRKRRKCTFCFSLFPGREDGGALSDLSI